MLSPLLIFLAHKSSNEYSSTNPPSLLFPPLHYMCVLCGSTLDMCGHICVQDACMQTTEFDIDYLPKLFSHLISWGRSFTWTQSSLIHPGKVAILLLRSPISASWALLVPHTYLTNIEMQAGDLTWALVLELAASILSTEPYLQLYTVTPAVSPAPWRIHISFAFCDPGTCSSGTSLSTSQGYDITDAEREGDSFC